MSDQLFIGLMSGTSLDGVDAVLIDCQNPKAIKLLGRQTEPFPPEVKDALWALQASADDELNRMFLAGVALAKVYAQAVKALLLKTGFTSKQIQAIGAHGQTVRHAPSLGYTCQINAPAALVELTGIAVVSDFRSRDIAAGGQGAPLVPAFHQQAFSTKTPRVILNLGGIANLSILEPGQSPRGSDTGPANMLMDHWAALHTGQAFDKGGQWGAQGQVNDALLACLIDHEPWFNKPLPKSTGRDLFNISWLNERLAYFTKTNAFAIEAIDVQATLQCFTARTVAMAINRLGAQGWPIFVCGGGALNEALMAHIAHETQAVMSTTDALGIPAQDVEAAAFAWLAWAHMQRIPANEPKATGAMGARVLGAYWPV
jgi:anhydro-N-acetylmuramic acid kinase